MSQSIYKRNKIEEKRENKKNRKRKKAQIFKENG